MPGTVESSLEKRADAVKGDLTTRPACKQRHENGKPLILRYVLQYLQALRPVKTDRIIYSHLPSLAGAIHGYC